ncbi:MAG TPA: chemotaxis protein CheW [Kiloniellaceae bacterium]
MSPAETKTPAERASLRARLAEAGAAMAASFEMTPERAAAILDERARLLAAPPGAGQPDGLGEYVIFRLGKTRFALESDHVQTVSRLSSLAAVPGLPAAFLGITNMRGVLLPVVDLGLLFGLARDRPADANRLIVLRRQLPDIAVLADSVEELALLQAGDLAETPPGFDRQKPSCVRGVTRNRIVVLHAASLLDEPGLRIGRQESDSI